jgi:hydrogenase maturation protease
LTRDGTIRAGAGGDRAVGGELAEHSDRAEGGEVIVVGLGNPILGDDAVGWHVVDAVEARLASAAIPGGEPGSGLGGDNIRFERLAVGGLALMERLVGFRRAILVDAMMTGTAPPGTVQVLSLADLPGGLAGHLDGAHDASLAVALEAGRALGASLPEDLVIVTIEAAQVTEFGESMSPQVAAAVPPAVEAVMAALASAAHSTRD